MKGHAKTYAALALLLALVGFLGGCIAGLFLHAPSDLARAALALFGLALMVLACGVVAFVYTTLDDGLSDEELEALSNYDDTPDDGSLGRMML